MRSFFGEVPLALAVLAMTLVAVIAFSRPVAHALGARRGAAALLILGFGSVVAATLVPTAAALEGVASNGTCDVSRVGLASFPDLTTPNQRSLNVLLFVPLGLAIGMLSWGRASALVLVLAVSLPCVVEAIQLALPVLGRGCQTADMIDNLLGLAIGACIGIVIRRFGLLA